MKNEIGFKQKLALLREEQHQQMMVIMNIEEAFNSLWTIIIGMAIRSGITEDEMAVIAKEKARAKAYLLSLKKKEDNLPKAPEEVNILGEQLISNNQKNGYKKD